MSFLNFLFLFIFKAFGYLILRFRRVPGYLGTFFRNEIECGFVFLTYKTLEKDSPDAAFVFLKVIRVLFSNNIAANLLLGNIQFELGNNDSALPFFLSALSRAPRYGVLIPGRFLSPIIQVTQQMYKYQSAAALDSMGWIVTRAQALEAARTAAVAGWEDFELKSILRAHALPGADDNDLLIAKQVEVVDIQNLPDNLVKIHKIAESGSFTFFEPEVFEDVASKVQHTLEVPSCWLAEIKNVVVIGGFCLLQNGKLVIYEPAAHPKNGLVAGAWKYVTGHPNGAHKALISQSYKRIERLAEGVLLSGRCSKNYFHWLIEYMPKFLAIERFKGLSSVPLLIEKGLAIQQIELLKIFSGEHTVVEVDSDTILEVERLWVPSIQTNMPDRFDTPYWESSVVSLDHIRFIRERVLSKLNLLASEGLNRSRRIYLSRRSVAGRKLINERELEKVFAEYGFECVYPEKLAFAEQVRLFNEAQYIAGPGGAALANSLFCREGATVISIVSGRNKGFSIHANVAKAVGAKYVHLTGEHTQDRACFDNEGEYAYSEFSVSIEKAIRLLKNLNL
jgi:capsular polysaccharide biosynthesis protein